MNSLLFTFVLEHGEHHNNPQRLPTLITTHNYSALIYLFKSFILLCTYFYQLNLIVI